MSIGITSTDGQRNGGPHEMMGLRKMGLGEASKGPVRIWALWAGSKILVFPITNGASLMLPAKCFFFFFKSSSKLYLSHSQRDIFKENIYGYFWHLSQFVTVHYAKNLLILLYQTISWQEFKPVYSLLSPRQPICIGSVPQEEDRPTV